MLLAREWKKRSSVVPQPAMQALAFSGGRASTEYQNLVNRSPHVRFAKFKMAAIAFARQKILAG